MNYSLSMSAGESAANLHDNGDRFCNRELAFRFHQAAEITAFHVLHGDEFQAAGIPDVKDSDYIFVGNLACEQQLLGKALRNFRVLCQFRADALQCDDAVNVAIMGFVNSAHTAYAEHFQDLKATAQHLSNFKDIARAAHSALRARRNGRPAYTHGGCVRYPLRILLFHGPASLIPARVG